MYFLDPLQWPHAYKYVSFINVFTYLQGPTNQYGFAEQTNAICVWGIKTKKRNSALHHKSNILAFLSTDFDYNQSSVSWT